MGTKTNTQKKKTPKKKQRKRKKRTGNLSVLYMFFLVIASFVTVYVSVVYLQLHAKNTSLHRDVINLQTQLSTFIRNNDMEYEKTLASLDLDKLRNIAINQLGMVYPSEKQIEVYAVQSNDYVRQYSEIE